MRNIEYSLVKTEGGDYLDQDGLSWDSPAQWLWSGILGGCGCGTSEWLATKAIELLNYFSFPVAQRNDIFDDDGFWELMAHWFDSVGLIEHGTSIAGSWLTDKGEQIQHVIEKILLYNK